MAGKIVIALISALYYENEGIKLSLIIFIIFLVMLVTEKS